MTEEDYIRKAVDLLGWAINGTAFFMAPWSLHIGISTAFTNVEQWELDAIAAELVRQVDALPDHAIPMASHTTTVDYYPDDGPVNLGAASGFGRTMNTIRAIIDSKVLEKEVE